MQRPNILFITSHDLGRHLNCYGQTTVHSPHLDRLAETGVRFANSFCAAPQCSPSRAAMATGRFPHANGTMGLTHANFAWDLHSDELHVAGLLRDTGYHTILASNAHEIRRAPTAVGFADHLGLGGKCGTIARGVCDWLRTRAHQDQPFYLQVAFFEPHRDYPTDYFGHDTDVEHGVKVPAYLVDEESARTEFALFQGAIRALDTAVGELVATLKQTAMLDNTLLMFVADHGIPFPRAKCTVYDPGLEVAHLMNWPNGGWAKPGKVFHEMISNVDYLPTLCDLLGIPAPPNLHGRSFAPLLRGQKYDPRREIFAEMTHHDYCDPIRAIRTNSHKLIVNFTSAPSFMDSTQSWRPRTSPRHPFEPCLAYHVPVELYDLKADPLETTNLAGKPEHAQVSRDLLGRLHEWMQQTNDALLKGIPVPPMWHAAMAALRSGQAPEAAEKIFPCPDSTRMSAPQSSP